MTYNNAPYLKECILSVFRQSHSNWELILVNNGSTDATKEVFQSFSDDRMRVIHLPKNIGVSAGRNRALESMTGDFFCFLDGDDVLPKNSLRDRLALFEGRPEVCFVDGSIHAFMGDTENAVEFYRPKFRGEPLSELLSLSGKAFGGNTWMVRRDPSRNYAFDVTLTHGEELLFYIDLAMDGGIYDYTETPVLYYRRHVGSAMSDLEALKRGYMQIALYVEEHRLLQGRKLSSFKRKIASIMLRSFLKKRRPFNAIKAYLQLALLANRK